MATCIATINGSQVFVFAQVEISCLSVNYIIPQIRASLITDEQKEIKNLQFNSEEVGQVEQLKLMAITIVKLTDCCVSYLQQQTTQYLQYQLQKWRLITFAIRSRHLSFIVSAEIHQELFEGSESRRAYCSEQHLEQCFDAVPRQYCLHQLSATFHSVIDPLAEHL